MSDYAIRVENLSKLYRIGGPQARYKTLRDTVMDVAAAPIQRLRRLGQPTPPEEIIWALKDVSFEVKHGEVLGIIGRNGSGKTTLLKVLSRITEPTEGQAEIHGRVGSLLEVGTGFHPELTGRENIYLSGAIQGMKRTEINRKFDEIVDFAEIEKFMDTPVKRYSSGMYVRLAFAVAAHLEPEILLVDEVLAVGDAAFQKKCLGRMGDVAKEGRTVLFVSHNMAAILALCQKGCLLEKGKLVEQGPAPEVVNSYLQSIIQLTEEGESVSLEGRKDRSGDGNVRLTSTTITAADGYTSILCTSRLKITIGYRSTNPVIHPTFLVGIYDLKGSGIFLLNTDAVGGLPERLPSVGQVTCITEAINLTPGRCFVNVAVLKGGTLEDHVPYAAYFNVEEEDAYGWAKVPPRSWVLCILPHEWYVEEGEAYNE